MWRRGVSGYRGEVSGDGVAGYDVLLDVVRTLPRCSIDVHGGGIVGRN